MKKAFLLTSLLLVATCLIPGPFAWAQATDANEFTLEEVTVTAEKRAVNLQQLPSAVSALNGDDLITQSKITTAQILESVPNLKFRDGGSLSPLGNIAIRGIQRTQDFRGIDEALPSTTAAYVDGVYLGIGGNYDINRVEVLRGPQGTLYGRSATGGVVSFYTNDPDLDKFGGNVSAEFGSDALVNLQGALNVPLGDKVAFRAAAHYYSRDGYFDAEGGQTKTTEGRLKVLYQPSDAFDIVLHAAMQETNDWSGGWSQAVDRSDPSGNSYVYENSYSVPGEEVPKEYSQYGLTANYDFGDMVLTWIAGYHDFEQNGPGVETSRDRGDFVVYQRADILWPENWYHQQELRLASDTEGRLTWLLGTNYFHQEFEQDSISWQTRVIGDPEVPEDLGDVLDHSRWSAGEFTNYGIFTEETYEITEDLRVTAGLRYDHTEFIQSVLFITNMNMTALENYLPPESDDDLAIGALYDDKHTWDNVTYKLRFDYDLTPDNMIYFTTATGFVPGFATVGPMKQGAVIYGWDFRVLDEQKLTSYEIGTKNQFLNNRLRVNGALFFYDVEGYPEVYELSTSPGPGVKTQKETPVEVWGVDLEVEYLPTIHDRISLAAGWQRPELQGWEGTVEWYYRGVDEPVVTDADAAAILKIQPGHPQFEATLGYDHTFALPNGSMLVPRAELHYTGSYYLVQMNYLMEEWGARPYNHQDAYMLCNANISWTSPNQKYSVNAWVRNAFDEEYKASPERFGLMESYFPEANIPTEIGDPQTFGVMVSARF